MNNPNKKIGRVFIGPVEIAGYYSNLAKGFKEIGVDCDYITYTPHPFGYGGETSSPALLRLAFFLNRFFRSKPDSHFILKVLLALPGELFTTLWAVTAIFKYNVFVFGFGQSLIRNNLDLKILKILNKIVISNIGHGSDARLPYIDGSYQSYDGKDRPSADTLCHLSSIVLGKIRLLELQSSVIIGAPFSSSYHLFTKFINWFSLGVPIQYVGIEEKVNLDVHNSNSLPIRILHSPSHPALKGTERIKEAINNLKFKGHSVELVLLHGKPHSEVIQEIQRCDFVVDQLFSDTPMAGFATEAAWFGKPAIVGGYALDHLKTLVSENMWPPSKTCHPDEIEQTIESFVINREERLRLGAEAQKFVHEKWNPAAVARRYLRIIDGDIPDEWWLDPRSVTYLEGCGQLVERTKENIRQMVEQFGIESLQLSHRPELEQAFLKFAEIKPQLDA